MALDGFVLMVGLPQKFTAAVALMDGVPTELREQARQPVEMKEEQQKLVAIVFYNLDYMHHHHPSTHFPPPPT